jgi:catechol 2,3-dioxygenase-like lactoylglutathione lyase family enzyme
MAETQTDTRIGGVGTVIVPVTDQDAALEFYTQKLGFEVRGDTPFGDGMRWIEVAPPGAVTTVAIVPPRETDPVGIEMPVALSTDDADAAHAALKERGVDVDEEVSRMGDPVPPMFWFRDQDGNSLFIVERE